MRASVASDLIVAELCARMGPAAVTLLYIDTPTHAHVVPAEYKRKGAVYKKKGSKVFALLNDLGMIEKAAFKTVGDGTGAHVVVNGLSVNQGPNYAVAKIMQRWRALVARDQGSLVSMTAGPAAKTDSVMHSPTMKVIMLNMEVVKPLIAHDPETVQALMTLIFIRDISSTVALAGGGAGHPLDLFYEVREALTNRWQHGPCALP